MISYHKSNGQYLLEPSKWEMTGRIRFLTHKCQDLMRTVTETMIVSVRFLRMRSGIILWSTYWTVCENNNNIHNPFFPKGNTRDFWKRPGWLNESQLKSKMHYAPPSVTVLLDWLLTVKGSIRHSNLVSIEDKEEMFFRQLWTGVSWN